jgi:fatty acid desaturase
MERLASLVMACAIGFVAGTYYLRAFFLYPAVVILIGACTKIWVHHQTQKLQRLEEQK